MQISNGVDKKFLAIRQREFCSLLQLRTTTAVLSSITLLAAFGFLLVAGGIKAGSEHNVSGFAWSENIGWISFNSTSTGGTNNYGVNIDSDGVFSGYAWSEHIGWISFAPLGPYPALPNYSAKLNSDNGEVSGWARALAYGGGWDGWIKMRGANYGVSVNAGNGEFSGWAWSDMVIGWISFKGINYKIITSYSFNSPPSAIDLSVSQPDYCIVSWPATTFSWQFTDPDGDPQSAYQIQVDNNSDFSSPEVDSLKVSSVIPNNSYGSYATLPGNLFWNTTYYWQVKVWDSEDLSSSWTSGPSFTTPKHAYPSIDFSWTPQNPATNEIVQFTDESTVFGGATKQSWLWTFQDGSPANSSLQNATTTFTSSGTKSVTLKVTDSDGFSCQAEETVNSQLPLPEWREVPPMIWLKNIFFAFTRFFTSF